MSLVTSGSGRAGPKSNGVLAGEQDRETQTGGAAREDSHTGRGHAVSGGKGPPLESSWGGMALPTPGFQASGLQLMAPNSGGPGELTHLNCTSDTRILAEVHS